MADLKQKKKPKLLYYSILSESTFSESSMGRHVWTKENIPKIKEVFEECLEKKLTMNETWLVLNERGFTSGSVATIRTWKTNLGLKREEWEEWSKEEEEIILKNYFIIGKQNTIQLMKDSGFKRSDGSIYNYTRRHKDSMTQLSPEDIYPNIDGKRINPKTGKLFVRGDTREKDDKFFGQYLSDFMTGKIDPRLTGLLEECWMSLRTYLGTNYRQAKQKAETKGWDFNLTKEYLVDIFPDDWMCPVFKTKMKINGGDTSPSIDRVDSTKGYIQGNIQWISYRANVIKNNGTIEEHEAIIKYMKDYS